MLDALETQYPIVDAKNLTPALFETLMRRFSCILVRNFIGMAETLKLRHMVEQTYEAYDLIYAQTQDGSAPPENAHLRELSFTDNRAELATFRKFGSLVLSFCNAASGMIAPVLSKSAVVPCVESYFGGPIGLSLNSSSLRLSERHSTVRRVFHQDGNFLGGFDTETINCWVALDPCGVIAPGLEVFPQRVPELLPAGQPGAVVLWEIAEETVYGRLGKENAWIPEFYPGDAFVFDHTHVHRTHFTENMTRDRYALECWMFPIKERYRRELLAWLG